VSKKDRLRTTEFRGVRTNPNKMANLVKDHTIELNTRKNFSSFRKHYFLVRDVGYHEITVKKRRSEDEIQTRDILNTKQE
jgi:hypothetical protein